MAEVQMKTQKIVGVVPILITPFDEQGRIDIDSLQSLIDFNIDAKVHGLGVALGSEIYKLSESERTLLIKNVIDHVAGRVPVVINSGAPGTDIAIKFSKEAENLGADALMAIPPHFMPVTANEIIDYYSAIDKSVSIPIFLQDIVPAPISPKLASQLSDDCENIHYIKVETLPCVANVGAMVDFVKDKLNVFGGAGGTYFIEEMRRGSNGVMPFCSQPEAFVQTWESFQDNDETTAREVFDANIMPVNRLTAQGGTLFFSFHKQLLVRLGVINNTKVRSPEPRIDRITQQEIEELIEKLVGN